MCHRPPGESGTSVNAGPIAKIADMVDSYRPGAWRMPSVPDRDALWACGPMATVEGA